MFEFGLTVVVWTNKWKNQKSLQEYFCWQTTYSGDDEPLTGVYKVRDKIARRAACEFHSGIHANLGIGIPTLATNYIPGKEIKRKRKPKQYIVQS